MELRDEMWPSSWSLPAIDPEKNTFAGLKRPIADEYDQVVLSFKR